MAFDKPQSRNEAILQNMLGANNELEPPKSRVEALLQDIAGQMPEANPSEGTTTGTLERLKIGDDIYTVEGGGSGTSDYDALNNKPQIAGVTLSGDKSLADLGIASATAVSGILDGTDIDSFGDVETALCDKVDKVVGKGLSTNDYDDTEKAAVSAATTAIAGIKDGTTIDSFGDVETALGAIQDGQSIDSFADVESAIGAIEDGTTIDSFADVESALADKQDATDSNLQTTADTIVGAINEHEGDIDSLKSGLTNLDNEVNGDATTYPYADVITIEDAIPANVADCSVKVEPVQDLHGQSAPYVGGAGKNKLPLVLADIKSLNTTGTWNGNVYTYSNITYTVLTDSDGNVTGIKVSGSESTRNQFILYSGILPSGSYVLNGCPTDGSGTTYQQFINVNGSYYLDRGSGASFTLDADTSITANIDIMIVSNFNKTYYPMIRLSTETDATFAPYTNICPISGHTEASVQRVGKNWFDGVKYLEGQYYQNGTKYVNANYDVYKYVLPVGNYVVKHIDSTTGLTNMVLCIDTYDSNGNIINYYQTNYNSGNPAIVPFSVDAETAYVYISVRKSAEQVQLEIGTQPTPYEPYLGQQYTLALGDTIYGGTVDFKTGVMTVTDAIVDMGTLTWEQIGGESSTSYKATTSGIKVCGDSEIGNLMCDIYYPSNYTSLPDGSVATRLGTQFWVRDSNVPSGTNFNDYISGHQLVYELATPTTIQLTPTQIQLLQGQNTLYASTGDISVSVNGVSGAIGGLTEDVAELQSVASTVNFRTIAISGTSGTIEEKLNSLYSVYYNLSDDEKKHVFVYYSNTVINVSDINNKRFSSPVKYNPSTGKMVIYHATINQSGSTMHKSEQDTNGLTITDISGTTDALKVQLCI